MTETLSPRHRRSQAGALAALAVVLAATGCTGTPHVEEGTAAPRSRSADFIARLAPDPADPAAAAPAIVAARRYLHHVESAVKAPERGIPAAMTEVAAGPVMENLRRQLVMMRNSGIVARGHVEPRIRSLGTRDSRFILLDCVHQGQLVVHHADSGRAAENAALGFAATVLVVRSDDGRWQVHEATTFSETTCPAGWDTGPAPATAGAPSR